MSKKDIKQEVIDLAISQVGYKEGKNNWNIYAKKLDEEPYFCTKKQCQPWCAVFMCWLFVMVLGSGKKARKMLYQPLKAKTSLAAVCTYFANYFKKAKKWFTVPQVGDIVFFKGGGKAIGHVGIVIQILPTQVVTIEGNHGDAVKRVVRKKSECVGFGRPDWSTDTQPVKEEVTVDLSVLKEGSAGEQVKTVQRLLKSMGYKGDKALVVDGKFGPESKKATISFQKAKKIAADGIVGEDTWNHLLKG